MKIGFFLQRFGAHKLSYKMCQMYKLPSISTFGHTNQISFLYPKPNQTKPDVEFGFAKNEI